MKITTIGIDLAKNVFQVHGVDAHGKAVLRKQLKREQMVDVLRQAAAVPDRHGGLRQRAPLGAQTAALGHTVRLMAPQFVKPYVKTNKNDAADAEAICEAVARPEHALRADQERRAAGDAGAAPGAPGFVKARTAQANQIRGLLGEFGLVIPRASSMSPSGAGDARDAGDKLPGRCAN